jgi:hypothetical protein
MLILSRTSLAVRISVVENVCIYTMINNSKTNTVIIRIRQRLTLSNHPPQSFRETRNDIRTFEVLIDLNTSEKIDQNSTKIEQNKLLSAYSHLRLHHRSAHNPSTRNSHPTSCFTHRFLPYTMFTHQPPSRYLLSFR